MTPDPSLSLPDPIVPQIVEPLYRARVWMKLLAVLAFVTGGFYVLTIVGVVIAWLPILIGVILWQAATAVEVAYTSQSPADARRSLDKVRIVFIIYGVLAALAVAGFLLLLALGIAGSVLEEADRVMR